MSLPEFKFNMRLKQGSPFGVTPNSYVNIYEVLCKYYFIYKS